MCRFLTCASRLLACHGVLYVSYSKGHSAHVWLQVGDTLPSTRAHQEAQLNIVSGMKEGTEAESQTVEASADSTLRKRILLYGNHSVYRLYHTPKGKIKVF